MKSMAWIRVGRRRVVLGLFAACILASPQLWGYSPVKTVTIDPNFSYKIDSASFSKITTHAVSSTEGIFWVQWALGVWADRSGIDITPTYGGTTTLDCDATADSTQVVGVSASNCFSPACGVRARWIPTTTSGNTITESDMCIYNGAATWELRQAYVAADSPSAEGERDFAAILVHEWGHWLGLNHTTATTMDGVTRSGAT